MPTELLQSLTLDARDTQLGDTNGVVIAKAIEANKPLQLFSLHAYATQLGETSGVAIAKAIEANKTLQFFSPHRGGETANKSTARDKPASKPQPVK